MRRLFLSLALAWPTVAGAADVGAGIELGVSMDLGDKVSGDYAKFGPGPTLRIPIFIGLGEAGRVRLIGTATTAFGNDRVSWGQWIDGAEVRFYNDDHWAMAAVGGVTAGVDAIVPGEMPVTPYIGGDLGVAWVGTYHSFSEQSQLLLDPDQNDLEDPGNVDPYTTQAALLTDLHAGIEKDLSDRLAVHVEMGYSVAFLKARELKKSPPELAARREAYGWNPLRLGVGLSTSF